jgi:hypothetical protein
VQYTSYEPILVKKDSSVVKEFSENTTTPFKEKPNATLAAYYCNLAIKARGEMRRREMMEEAKELELKPAIMTLLGHTEIQGYVIVACPLSPPPPPPPPPPFLPLLLYAFLIFLFSGFVLDVGKSV